MNNRAFLSIAGALLGACGSDCADIACGKQGLYVTLVGGGSEMTTWSFDYDGKHFEARCPDVGHSGEPGSVGCWSEGDDIVGVVYDASSRVRVRIVGDSGRVLEADLEPDYETTHVGSGDCTLRCDEGKVTLDWRSAR